MITPPAPCTGSPMKAATLSGPISRIRASSASAAGAAEFFRIAAEAFVEEIGLLDLGNARKPGPALALHRVHPADACAGDG